MLYEVDWWSAVLHAAWEEEEEEEEGLEGNFACLLKGSSLAVANHHDIYFEFEHWLSFLY